MLPTLRVILATVIAACAAVLAMSADMISTRDLGEHLSGVPSMSRPLVRQAIVEDAEWRHLRLLAYARRADELQRLRDLPTAPARAVIEYAERAQKAEAARTPSSVASPSLAPTLDAAGAAVPPAPSEMTVATPPGTPPATQPAPAVIASTPTAAPPPDEPTAVASAPTAMPAEPTPATPVKASATAPAETPAATPAEMTATAPVATITEAPPAPSPQTAPVDAPEPAAIPAEPAPTAASGATQIANVPSGSGETTDIEAAEKPAKAKAHHGLRSHARRETRRTRGKNEARVARTRLPSSAKTGFAIDLPAPAASSARNPLVIRDIQQDSH